MPVNIIRCGSILRLQRHVRWRMGVSVHPDCSALPLDLAWKSATREMVADFRLIFALTILLPHFCRYDGLNSLQCSLAMTTSPNI